MSEDAPDKRLYRRVDVVLPFRFRVTDRAAMSAWMATLESPPPDVPADGDPVMRALDRIERKVDRLLASIEPDDPFSHLPSIGVNLSGAGVRFGADIPMTPATVLDMSFILPTERPIKIRAFGEVLRSKKIARSQGVVYETAVAFLVLSAPDRESIIRYTFQTQGH